MILFERTIQEQMWLLIPLFALIFSLSKINRKRPILLKSIALSHFSKTHFKHIENNKSDQYFIALYWIAVFFNCIYVYNVSSVFFDIDTTICVLIPVLIFLKKSILKASGLVFDQKELFNQYVNSHYNTIIIIGLIILPSILINIIYPERIPIINKAITTIVLFFLFYRLMYLFHQGSRQKISYFHLFLYLCTLEIVPWAVVIGYILVI